MKIFKNRLKFHPPGLAPVEDETGWYHIDIHEKAVYPQRYKRTFGYYDGLAAVTDFSGNCFHIDTSGQRVYNENYVFCGNFQEEKCVVRDSSNGYFHIDKTGKRLYAENYRYAGDFKDGYACVMLQDGLYKHIDSLGNFINEKAFHDLGVFHKGFATAKDERGWFHIDLNGDALYSERYLQIEPFYNGFALVTTFSQDKEIIDEVGRVILTVR